MEMGVTTVYNMGLQHMLAVIISLLAVVLGLRLSFQFGGSIGTALRWFCAGLFIITFPHTLEFLTVTHKSLPLSRDVVRLLKAISYIVSALLFLYSFYLLRKSIKEGSSAPNSPA